jgi:hypothetical protein
MMESLIEYIKTNNIRSFRSQIKKEKITSYYHSVFLKLIIIYNRYEILKEYHKLYPKNITNYNMIGLAIEYNREKCLSLLLTYISNVSYNDVSKAARNGNFNILKTVLTIVKRCDSASLYYAALSGSINCVKYIKENVYFQKYNYFNDYILLNAAKSGNIDVFNYLYQYKEYNINPFSQLIKPAIEGGSVDILEFILTEVEKVEQNSNNLWYEDSLLSASEFGNINMFQFIIKNKYHTFNYNETIDKLFSKGYFGVFSDDFEITHRVDFVDQLYKEIRIKKEEQKLKNIFECFYILIEENMKQYNTVNLEKVKLSNKMCAYFNIDHSIVRTCLFKKDIKMISPLKELIEDKKTEIRQRIDYFIKKDRLTLDVVKYVIAQYL